MAQKAVLKDRHAAREAPLDLVHLTRQTLGDANLEREVLSLFASQSRLYVERMTNAKTGEARRMAAHTILGSARSVGAWRVAAAAKKCSHDRQSRIDLGELANEVAFVRAFIAEVLAERATPLKAVG